MRPNLPFLSTASNALLKPDGLLRWKKRLVKDARLSLPLTEVMKIARLTSPLLDAPRQSSPRPRLRHGRRLALLSHLGLTLNLYSLLRAIAGSSSSSSSSPNFPNCSSPRELALVYAAYLRSHLSVSQRKALRSKARGYLTELRRATCPNESHSYLYFFLYLFIFILHSRESELYRYILDGTSALAWELPFLRFLGHLSST